MASVRLSASAHSLSSFYLSLTVCLSDSHSNEVRVKVFLGELIS